MNSLARELKGEPPAPDPTYSLIFPPGWAQFPVDREAEAQLIQNIRELYHDGGRPDIAADVRTRLHVYFRRLRSIKAKAIYLPIRRVDDLVLPVSIAAVPYTAPPGRTIPDSVAAVARAEVEEIAFPFATVYRWQETRDRVEREQGVSSETVTYLFPLPGENQREGILLTYAVLRLTEDADPQFTEVLIALFDAIMGTFRWKQA